jgi:peptidoglycan/xylan/chitin deacetylase (PgdA/CDA1 family)
MMFRTPFFLPLMYPQLIWRIKTSEKKIFLTFDDGPVPGPTEYVLETLEKFNTKATFFCIGDNVKKHPEIFRMVLAGGHAIGNHTFHHLKGWNHSTHAYLDNIELCKNEFTAAGFPLSETGAQGLFRPPYGRIKMDQVKSLNNYRIVMWDVLTHDYAASYSHERCLKGSVKATRPGSIVVFHDSIKAERNLRYVLPRYIQHFSDQGFSFGIL